MALYFLIGGLSAVVFAALGLAAGVVVRKRMVENRVESVNILSRKIVDEAKAEANHIKKDAQLQAKDVLFQMKQEFEAESKERRAEALDLERRLSQKEISLEKKSDQMQERESVLLKKENRFTDLQASLEADKENYNRLVAEQRTRLEALAGMSAEEAREALVRSIEEEARIEAARRIKRIEQETRENSLKRGQEIIAQAVKRYAGDYVAEKTVSVVNLPSDDMKGRIIGREGRNIRALEAATGIDLIIDDTPEAVILSGFNPVRREVARQSLERLISDGRIHPARIEEVVKKVSSEMDVAIREIGEQATFDVGVHGIHNELVNLIGKLKYRSSYAQNVLQHSIEVSFLCGIMASELGLNVKQAKRSGLLHDIGKAVDHEIEGPHAMIGADLLKKYGESAAVVHAVAAHHEDVEPNSVLAVLVQAADTLSGARPGARREMLETYVKRLEDLERIAKSFKGVSQSYAIQAGREVRIIVESEKVSDEESLLIARDIAKKIETELTYPGQIKITVIRETRAVHYAR
jgi:ribonuclease Y